MFLHIPEPIEQGAAELEALLPGVKVLGIEYQAQFSAFVFHFQVNGVTRDLRFAYDFANGKTAAQISDLLREDLNDVAPLPLVPAVVSYEPDELIEMRDTGEVLDDREGEVSPEDMPEIDAAPKQKRKKK